MHFTLDQTGVFFFWVTRYTPGYTTLLRRGSPTAQAKTREKKKAEPLTHNVRSSAQKSRFLACATTTTVQTEEGEFVQ